MGKAAKGTGSTKHEDEKKEDEKKKEGIQSISLVLRGKRGSRLVVHRFADKAKQEIRDKHAKKKKEAKEKRDPEREFLDARCVDDDGNECVPITALKKSVITAATAFDNLTKVALRQAIFVDSTDKPGADLIPILTLDNKPAKGVMREDAVTIGQGKRGLTYRPEYPEWMIRVTFEYNPRLVSEDQLLGLIEQAGWGVGICEGRPEKSSALGWGRFEIV